MSDVIRVALKSDPEKWVEVKKRWTYFDKATVMESKEPTGVAMLHAVVTNRNFDTPVDLALLDDEDAEPIVEAIAKARNEQMGALTDPNS